MKISGFFYLKIFYFFMVVKFSIYLNRRDLLVWMKITYRDMYHIVRQVLRYVSYREVTVSLQPCPALSFTFLIVFYYSLSHHLPFLVSRFIDKK